MRGDAAIFDAVVEALRDTDAYPHRPAVIELRQTHISCAFLAGPFVYKIKKPVCFPFVDYSTLERRRHFCQEEVRLNQRLARDVYLGVVPIFERDGRIRVGDGAVNSESGRIVEYAVKMRRLPEERMLSELVAKNGVAKGDIARLARKLFFFHRRAAKEKATRYGSVSVLRERWSENFRETAPFVGQEIGAQDYGQIRDYAQQFLDRHAPRFERRAREGKVCEGHGDLRAEHVCVVDGIIVFDCVEFSESFRYADVSSELAFLAMDLDFLDRPGLGAELVQAYEQLAADEEISLLLPFYKSYRAYVRGKVECFKSRQEEVPEPEREYAKAKARRHFALAYRYAKGPPAAALVIVCGLPGTGKSTLAQLIRDRTGFSLLSSDVTRKRLAGVQATAPADAPFGTGIYRADFTDRTYRALLSSAEESLVEQQGVIVDATFKDAKHRQFFLDMAARLAKPLVVIECRAAEAKILERLRQRERDPQSTSDATPEIYRGLRDEFMPLTDVPADRHIIAETDGDLHAALARLDHFLYPAA
ncbi:MAG TPA: AAA family ATPase [Candidatus Acidoferrales bacterium]|nr:AAA family ATPase [Candidatus Acidoferrales bacterium]